MTKQDIYQVVTDRILEALDRGTVPWRNPITPAPGSGGLAFPTNLESGKPYRGINVFLLATTAMCEGYRSAYWLTFRQAKEKGGNVRKGEKATPIVFFKKLEVDDPEGGGEDGKKHIPMLKKYSVFNLEQIDGIETPDTSSGSSQDDEPRYVEPVAAADTILKGYVLPPTVETGGYRAYYRPATDTVKIPSVVDFEDAASHACTFFHELVHSTGHSKRMDRGLDQKLPDFGAPAYGKEELIAECGSAFLCATAGILPDTIEQSAAYIDGWRKTLKADKKVVVQAAAAAQRAVDHILGVSWDEANDNTAGAVGRTTPSRGSREKKLVDSLKADLQAFPLPGQANLNSTATAEERSAYISAVLGWWNDHVEEWTAQGVLNHQKNPVVNPNPVPVKGNFPANVPGCGPGGA